jgi:hypothetical protein
MGEKPAKGLNGGIIHLAFAPFVIAAMLVIDDGRTIVGFSFSLLSYIAGYCNPGVYFRMTSFL